jgi:energy-coupling factor transport system ATP-binding protein
MGDVNESTIIAVKKLTYRYRQASQPVLRNIDLAIGRSDYLLITGRSGSGKSTLCRTFNGLIPHFYGGVLSGDVWVAGQAVSQTPVGQLFDQVAMVFQNPDAQLFCRSVAQEVAFGLESLGLGRRTIAARLDGALDRTGIAKLRRRDPQTLSGGEKHLVLIAALLALRPKVMVLDEPFADLDPANVQMVRRLLRELHAAGCGIVVCEHRLSRAAPDATRMVVLHQGRIAADGDPQAVLAKAPREWGLESPLAARVGAALELDPLPRTIQDLRAFAPRPELIDQMEPCLPEIVFEPNRPAVVEVDHLDFCPEKRAILDGISFALHPGECIAVVGANGAGKTTLLRQLIGLQRPTQGRIRIKAQDTRATPINELAREIGLAFQNPDNQFFRYTVDQEIRVGPEALGRVDSAWIDELTGIFRLQAYRAQAPYRLSGGEKKRVAFASALASRPAVLALDEPTAGQDFKFRRDLRAFLRRMQATGQVIIIVTHDLTFAERAAGRWLLMAHGRLLADDAPDRIMADPALMARAGLEATDRFRLAQMWRIKKPGV